MWGLDYLETTACNLRVTAVDEKSAFCGFEDPHEESKEGRFSGAVGAEQSADLAGRNRNRDVIERDFSAK